VPVLGGADCHGGALKASAARQWRTFLESSTWRAKAPCHLSMQLFHKLMLSLATLSESFEIIPGRLVVWDEISLLHKVDVADSTTLSSHRNLDKPVFKTDTC
jgi:hypothetical protein